MEITGSGLKPGMKIKVTWVDGEVAEGDFVANERGYIVIKTTERTHACLPAHLRKLEIISVT